MPTYNFDAVETAEAPRTVEAGDYIAKITHIDLATSSKGTEGIKVSLRLERLVDGDRVDRDWSDTWWLTPRTAPYVKARIVTITGTEPTGDFNFNRLVGLRTIAVLRKKQNAESGATYLEVVGYNPLPTAERDPLMAASSAVQDAFPGSAPTDVDEIPF